MLAYIDAGTAAAIAAVATGGLAGAKVAAQSFVAGFRGKKKSSDTAQAEAEAVAPLVEETEDFEQATSHQRAA